MGTELFLQIMGNGLTTFDEFYEIFCIMEMIFGVFVRTYIIKLAFKLNSQVII